jgi:site-specific recombinase XerD
MQELSQKTLKFYEGCLKRAPIGIHVTPRDIDEFLKSLHCSNGGKHGYFKALRVFYRWLYSPKSGYNLNPQDNPILLVEAPKVEKRILPSLSLEQVDFLIQQADKLRDKAIISLLADSGIRLNELTNIRCDDIDFDTCTVTIIGKGNKQRRTPFTSRTANFLRELISQNQAGSNIWHLNYHGIEAMLKRLKLRTGLPTNAHTFRRTFAV